MQAQDVLNPDQRLDVIAGGGAVEIGGILDGVAQPFAADAQRWNNPAPSGAETLARLSAVWRRSIRPERRPGVRAAGERQWTLAQDLGQAGDGRA
jgi:hypothetical protein